jgi:hypothetical protein
MVDLAGALRVGWALWGGGGGGGGWVSHRLIEQVL